MLPTNISLSVHLGYSITISGVHQFMINAKKGLFECHFWATITDPAAGSVIYVKTCQNQSQPTKNTNTSVKNL